MKESNKVCIIGAGASGLCTARQIIKINNELESDAAKLIPVIFEKNDAVGGTWIYTDENSEQDHSSMYKNLYTNLPKECMAFPDYSFPTSSNSYLHHSEVRKYLENYTNHFNLESYIRFGTEVVEVKPVKQNEIKSDIGGKSRQERWLVTSKNHDAGTTETDEFVGVVVSNGHYSVPYCPEISGLKNNFKGMVLHSHTYREPEFFKNKVVLVLGASNSGQDIGMEIAEVAKSVILSSNNPPLSSPLPKNMTQELGINHCNGPDSFIMKDKKEIKDVDVLLLCTGYKYDYPFLSKSCDVSVQHRMMIKPLFKHVININHPTMCFIGTCSTINPFPQFNLQAQLYVKYLAGLIDLPSKEEMMDELRNELEMMENDGKPLRHFHKLGMNQFAYNKDIASIANVEDVPSYVERLFYSVVQRRFEDVMNYKKDKYNWTGHEYELIKKKSLL